jgi:hypothetical protein
MSVIGLTGAVGWEVGAAEGTGGCAGFDQTVEAAASKTAITANALRKLKQETLSPDGKSSATESGGAVIHCW